MPMSVFLLPFLAAALRPCGPAVLPPDFIERAYLHITAISAMSPRPAASAGERKAIGYVRDRFRELGLRTVVENFSFESYAIRHIELRIGDAILKPLSVAFNPYAGVSRYEGTADLVEGIAVPEGENRFLFSARPDDFFQLMLRRPKLIVFVSPGDLVRLKAARDRRFRLEIDGIRVRRKSANVIGELGSSDSNREIIVCAHLDAFGSSLGASDNASGVGVLIEVARHCKRMERRFGARIRFVGFGGEELGLLGSRAYVLQHSEDLRNCAFNLNIDDIGGPRCPSIETKGGVAGLPERAGVNLFPADLITRAWQGQSGDWRLLDSRIFPAFGASNHPEWLKAAFDKSATALGIQVNHTGTMGSDQSVFTQAGVIATGVGCASVNAHTPADQPKNVLRKNLELVGRLVACIVEAEAADPGERIARTAEAISLGADSAARREAILARLNELNLRYRLQTFSAGSATGMNVIVEPEHASAKTVLLGAHYDRVSHGRGAVDDASGAAAVLELLTAFQRKPLRNLALGAAFFDLEESGLVGSKAHVSERRAALPAYYVNFDVFAFGDTLWALPAKDSPLTAALQSAAAQHAFVLAMEEQAPPGDDKSFREAGVQALGLALVPHAELEAIHRIFRGEAVEAKPSLAKIIHSPEDTPDKVKGAEVVRAIRVVESAIRRLDSAQQDSSVR